MTEVVDPNTFKCICKQNSLYILSRTSDVTKTQLCILKTSFFNWSDFLMYHVGYWGKITKGIMYFSLILGTVNIIVEIFIIEAILEYFIHTYISCHEGQELTVGEKPIGFYWHQPQLPFDITASTMSTDPWAIISFLGISVCIFKTRILLSYTLLWPHWAVVRNWWNIMQII